MTRRSEAGLGLRRLVGLIDVTLTAGQAALWKAELTNAMLLPILRRMDDAGFRAIDVIDPEVFAACVERLGEDPWERIRLAARRLTATPPGAWIAGRCLFGSSPQAVARAVQTVERLADAGIRRLGCYDPLNEIEALAPIIAGARRAGMTICGGVIFALSPTHDDGHFVERVRQLVALGCDAVALLDLSGILHPDRVRSLVPQLRAAVPDVPLELRTHCASGRAEIACLEALRLGADAVHTATEAASGGESVPSTDFFATHLARDGTETGLHETERIGVRAYFEALAERWRLRRGIQLLHDPARDRHQLPAAFPRATDERLRERISALRARLGDPPMSPPVAAVLWAEVERQPDGEAPGVVDMVRLLEARGRPLPGQEVDGIAAPHRAVDRQGWDVSGDTPLQLLMDELERRPWVRRLALRKGDWRLDVR